MTSFSALKLTTRVYAILVAALIVIFGIGVATLYANRENAFKLREKHLSDVVDTAVSVAAAYQERAKTGEFSTEEAKKRAAAAIGKMRFDGKNYFFVFNFDSIVVVHGVKPQRNGTDQSGYADPNGVRVYAELSKMAKTTATAS